MNISLRASNGWRLSETPFPFQQTYVTPLGDLPNFVRSILTPFDVNEGAVWIEQVIFKPGELIWYLRGKGIATDEGQLNLATLQAENATEVLELLECVLSQWTDFAFIPSPKEFVVYADHDEYTTIFTAAEQTLNLIRSDMQMNGFKEVEGWAWTRPHSPGKVEENKENV